MRMTFRLKVLDHTRSAVLVALVAIAVVGATPMVATASSDPDIASLGVHHVCPAPDGDFIDSWGFARSGGRRHKGVDMMAPYGSPVLAPTDGVVRSHTSSLGGLSFYLDGFDGVEYYGAHLATIDRVGLVAVGDQIGTVGTTGNANTPHLHFEVHPSGGSAVNPFPFTQDWCQIPDWNLVSLGIVWRI
jgi:murein DD-endopeptidase MepM/ murein hydrolase activator NlpD